MNAQDTSKMKTATTNLTVKEIREYNRRLLQMTEWYSTENSTLIEYRFHFEGHDDDQIHDDYWTVVRSCLMNEREIEKIWDCIAEQNYRHFVRGNLEITYPHCDLLDAGEF